VQTYTNTARSPHTATLLGLLDPEDKGTMILQNVGTCLPNDTAQHPRSQNHQQHQYENLKSHCTFHPNGLLHDIPTNDCANMFDHFTNIYCQYCRGLTTQISTSSKDISVEQKLKRTSNNKSYSLNEWLNGDRSSTVVKVLCYKSEGHWFNSRWCHGIFQGHKSL
jgi:hypothetical protein